MPIRKDFDNEEDFRVALRDYFAAAAFEKAYDKHLAVAVARIKELVKGSPPRDGDDDVIYDHVAREAYRFADAMWKARIGGAR